MAKPPSIPTSEWLEETRTLQKNWLFAGSETAGKRAAAIMSPPATAKANGHEPHAWLTDVLTRLPTTLDRNIETLLLHRWQQVS